MGDMRASYPGAVGRHRIYQITRNWLWLGRRIWIVVSFTWITGEVWLCHSEHMVLRYCWRSVTSWAESWWAYFIYASSNCVAWYSCLFQGAPCLRCFSERIQWSFSQWMHGMAIHHTQLALVGSVVGKTCQIHEISFEKNSEWVLLGINSQPMTSFSIDLDQMKPSHFLLGHDYDNLSERSEPPPIGTIDDAHQRLTLVRDLTWGSLWSTRQILGIWYLRPALPKLD